MLKELFNQFLKLSYWQTGDGKTIPTALLVDVNGDPAVLGGGSGAASDRELVVTTYRCKTAFTGASVGDTITATQIIDVSSATPSTVSTVWRNQTTVADLGSVPSASTLELTGTTALTSAQLTAAGLATETTLAAQSAKLPASIGQKAKTASLAVVLASDQDTLKTAEQAGSGAMRYLSDTTALTAVSYSYIQVITDTVFTTLTNTNSTAGTLTTLTIPAGTVLRGSFTAITLTSGAVALYV